MTDTIHIYKDKAGESRWKRISPNGDEVSNSGEGYIDHQYAEEAAVRESQGQDVKIVHDDEG